MPLQGFRRVTRYLVIHTIKSWGRGTERGEVSEVAEMSAGDELGLRQIR